MTDSYHYQLTCINCGNTWFGLHCPHDGYQNPCPNCKVKPKPIEGVCGCVLVAPVEEIDQTRTKTIDEILVLVDYKIRHLAETPDDVDKELLDLQKKLKQLRYKE